MTTEDNILDPGDQVRLRSGPYAGQTGAVVKVQLYINQSAADAPVLVKLINGRINSCPPRNPGRVKELPVDASPQSAKKGGKK